MARHCECFNEFLELVQIQCVSIAINNEKATNSINVRLTEIHMQRPKYTQNTNTIKHYKA